MRHLVRILCAIALIMGAPPVASAGPLTRTIAQYKHTRWTVDDGAPLTILSLAEGRDGFLWIGSGEGLFRFDGKSFEQIPPERQIGDRAGVSATLAARDGSIWVGYSSGGIARYSSGKLRDMDVPHPTENVQRLRQTPDGAIWALLGSTDRPLVRFLRGKWTEVASDWGLPIMDGADLIVARDGTLWVSAHDWIFFLRPGARRFERAPFSPVGLAGLAQDASGNIWAADQETARVVGGAKAASHPYPIPYGPRSRRAFFDHNGDLWGSSSELGIYKINKPKPLGEDSAGKAASKVERFRAADSLTSDNVSVMMEDREGNLWVGTNFGLDRFRAVPVIREPSLTLGPQWGAMLLATKSGDVFFGQHDGVFRAQPGGAPARVFSGGGEPEALCEGLKGDIWIVTQQKVVRFSNGVVETVARPRIRRAIADCAVDDRGTLFLTAAEGLLERTKGGWRAYSLNQDDETGGAMPLMKRRDGGLLTYATSRSLRLYRPPGYSEIALQRAAALRQLRVMHEEGESMLLGGRFGMARWRGTKFEFISGQRVPVLRGTYGIATTPDGYTWLMCRLGIVRIASADLDRAFANPSWTPPARLFDNRDGLPGGGHGYGTRQAVRGGDGRLWFATRLGTVWLDPASLERNSRAPPVTITMLRVDGGTYRDPTSFVVPPHANKLVIAFSAISLGLPERVRVRYRLEGADDSWTDAGSLRQVSYNDLAPGKYRFHVIAANEDGVWNSSGAVLDLTIEPTFFQSLPFKIICALAALMLLWGAYSIRTRQLTARLRERLETRHAERERIARELHDTLLQGFQGLVLRFQSVANRMSPGSELRPPLDNALEEAEQVLTEGRNRVGELRSSENDPDLAGEIARVAANLVGDSTIPVTVTVEGRIRALDPVVREELLRISEEAIRNALRHASPSLIEVGLVYAGHVRLGIRDDGSGLPADVAAAGGRPGHFGLTGMRERADRAGGRLELSTSQQGGTEIRVTVPGRLAYLGRRTQKGRAFVTSRS